MIQPKVLAIIPARSGSKGLPGKNIKILGDKPLIAWTIEASLNSENISKTVVTTDCEEISNIAKEYGAEVPFLRPADLSGDSATTADVVMHVISNISEEFDAVVLLQPTSPFRTELDIKNAFELYNTSNTKSVVSVMRADKSPYWCFSIDENNEMFSVLNVDNQFSRRQELPSTYLLNGAIYIVNVKSFIEQKKFIFNGSRSYIMCKKSSLDIDDIMDFKLAQLMTGEK